MKEAAYLAEADTCEACGRERHPDTALYVGACRPQFWTYCSRANTGQGAIIPTGVQEEAAAADPGAVEAAADGEGQEVSEESADIVIRHTSADGTTVEGTSKGDKAGAILRRKEYGRRGGMAFRWGYDMQAWYLRNSRDGDADMWTVRKLRGYLEEAGYTVAVVIDNDAERAYADAVQEQYDRAEDRAERYSGYAANASARSEGAWKASHAIADHMTGEPIKVGHHSERRHRRDIERMDGHMRRSIEEERKAAYHAQRAISAEHFEEFKKNPARTLRRLDGPAGLRKQLRDVDKWAAGESACGYTRSTTAEGLETLARERRRIVEKIAYWESVIAEAEAAGFKVWGPADFAKGDFVHTGGTWRQVLRVNKKSLTVPHILTRTGVPVVRSEDRTCTAGTVSYGRPSPCKGGGRCTCDTSTITYDTVRGWASAADIARMEAAEAEPEAERTVCPHCKRVANGEKRFSTARGMCTVCGYARPQNFKPKPVPVLVEGQAEEEPTEVADAAELSGEGSSADGGQEVEAADDPAQIDELPEPAPKRLTRPAVPALVAGPERDPGAFGDMVAVFMASQGGSPARQRVLWWMPRRDAQAVCSDARTSGARFMLCWTAEPGEHGTDWDFVTDDGRFAGVLRDVYARPVTAEGYAERRPGTCHSERWCGHAWPCGRDAEAWQARQPKSRAQLRHEAQAEARSAKAAAPVRPADALDSAADLPVAGPVPVRHALPAAPVRLAIEAAPAPVVVSGDPGAEFEAAEAARTVAGLGWCREFADVVRTAAHGHLMPEEGGKFRALGAVGQKGKPVKAERVRLLLGAGFLALDSFGLVVATGDGREALRLVDQAPDALMPEADVMAAVRKARRARQWDSKAGRDANALAVLPGGGEEARRRAEARKGMDRWQREAEESRKRTEAMQARARIKDRRERKAEEQREAERNAPCRECRGVYPVEYRCGRCRERAAMGLPLVDFLALPPVPLPVICAGATGVLPVPEVVAAGMADERGGLGLVAPGNTRLGTVQPDGDGGPDEGEVRALLTGQPGADEDQEQDQAAADVVSDSGTVDGWEGDGGACPQAVAPLVDEAWRHPRGGTASPVLPAVPVSREVTGHDCWESGEWGALAGPAGCPTYASVAGRCDSLDVFAALDAELSAAAADWDQLIPA
jgi:hypothetical protein